MKRNQGVIFNNSKRKSEYFEILMEYSFHLYEKV